jgi:hypothetical protein
LKDWTGIESVKNKCRLSFKFSICQDNLTTETTALYLSYSTFKW